MKVIDGKGRVFERINLIDLTLIIGIFIIAALVFTTFTKQGKAPAVPEDKIIDYTVVMRGIQPDTVPYIKKGDLVRKQVNQALIGTIKDVKIKPALTEQDVDGAKVVVASPISKDVFITIETKGRAGGDLIATGNEVLRVGDSFNIVTKWFVGGVTISDIVIKGD